jgi:hypothetical protein
MWYPAQALIFHLWALIVLRKRRWIYGLCWLRGGLFSEETVWLYVGHCDRYVGRSLKGVSKLMRAIREFRLPTTNSDRATPRKSESLITTDQSFNVNYTFIPATKLCYKMFSCVCRLNATSFRRQRHVLYFGNECALLHVGLINNRDGLRATL